MSESLKNKFKGIRFQHINTILTIFGCLLMVVIFFFSLQIKSKYQKMESMMTDYIECNKAVVELRDASDFLTNQVRLYAMNLEPEFMENYFYEYSDLKRREISLEILEMSHEGDAPDINLKMALSESQYLAKKEFYAMKAISLAIDYPMEFMPEVIRKVELSKKDMLLSSEEKIALARNIISDTDYLASKDRITFYANNALSSLINDFIKEKKQSNLSIINSFTWLTVAVVISIIASIVLYIFIITLILIPLNNYLIAIQRDIHMPQRGAYEVRYIASAYNALRDKNAVTASILKHKAEHDPLTGLINRNAFDQIKTALMGAAEPVAYLIIDIDLFKVVNDSYGHPAGDLVLKKVSSLLMKYFRSSDYVARIGGDEFAVIMTKLDTSSDEIIKQKILSLNEALSQSNGELPSVTVSAGVSFSEKGYVPDLVEKADKALYSVKRNGRCNCAFYEDIKASR